MPNVFIKWLTDHGDVVYDPFSGRGTTALEACLLGRVGYASDANPLAHLLSRAKADPPAASTVYRRMGELRARREVLTTDDVDPRIRILFDQVTLGELLWLKEELNTRRRTDAFLMATLLGVTHMNANRLGEPQGLTVAMPNTFAMAPTYIGNYVRKHKLKPPKVSVLDKLEERFGTFSVPSFEKKGKAWRRDASGRNTGPVRKNQAKLVFTSPPYLEVMKYAKFNWIRLWVLGEDPKAVDERLFASSSVTKYLTFMETCVRRMLQVTRSDGYVTLVLGDVTRNCGDIRLADQVAKHLHNELGARVLATISDELPIDRKVSRIWGSNRGRATRTDRILILTHADGPDLPAIPKGLAVGYP